MSAFRKYTTLLEQLYRARSEQELTMQEEYVFACDLESLWDELSEAEQEQVEDLAEEHKADSRIIAPEELTTDVPVALDARTMPRVAA
jgi:hypothetical protein